MNRLAAALAVLLLFALPAEAHRLKLFAQATGENIAGYGFFIGGGRPQGADLVVTTPDGKEVSRLKTGTDGGFSFTPPAPGRYHLSLAAGDGHFAELDISTDGTVAAPAAVAPQASVPTDLDARIETAVARQIRPLLEAYDAADGRVRFNDLLGGLGWIVGLAGLWAWLRSRRDRHGD
jgi:nickel transport protein